MNSMDPLDLTFVTGNPHKLKEVLAILSKSKSNKFKLTNRPLDLPELQGTSISITTEKALLAAAKIQGPVLVEDTCLCFNALQGLPGPYIKWFLDAIGQDGLYKLLHGFEDKTGYALCTFGVCLGPGMDVQIFQGRTDGRIVAARGPNNFGWDTVFEPDVKTQKLALGNTALPDSEVMLLTYAEMTKESKNIISHRKRALDGVKAWLDKL